MTTIRIFPESDSPHGMTYCAVAGDRESTGKTVSEALDALTPQLTLDKTGMLVIVQRWCPDHFFTASQRQRLEELMRCWRNARDTDQELPSDEQAELEKLIEAETQGAAERAEAALQELSP